MAGNSDLGHPNHKNIIELHNGTLIRKTKIKKNTMENMNIWEHKTVPFRIFTKTIV